MTTAIVFAGVAVSVALTIYIAAGYSWFSLRYSRTTFGRTPYGRHLLSHSAALAATFWATLLNFVEPLPLWAALLIQIGLFSWLAVEVTRRNRLFSQDQKGARRLNVHPPTD